MSARESHGVIALRIGGILVKVASTDLTLQLHRGAVPFQVAPEQTADLSLVARRADLSHLPSARPVFDSGGVWQLVDEGDAWSFRFRASQLGPTPYKVARVQRDLRRGEILLHTDYFSEGQKVDALEYPLDEVLFVHELARRGAVELHACAVRDADGTGLLFVGHSGAGKSTMARTWTCADSQVRVLSDDRVVVRKVADQHVLFGTPWHGEGCFARAESARLSAVFVITHGAVNSARRLAPSQAAAQLFARAFTAFHSREAIEGTLAVLQGLVRGIPVFSLEVVPTLEIVTFVRALLRRSSQ